MNCDWAEKISLLIDGELPSEERRATESHLESCAACRRTQEDFLSLRSVVSSYPLASDAAGQRRALEKILAAGTQDTRAADATMTHPSWRELLRWPRLTPALASALAVLWLAVALGVVWTVSRRDSEQTLVAEGPAQDKARQSSTGPAKSDAPAPKASNPDAPTPDAPKSDVPASGGPSEPAPKKDAPGGVNAPGRKLFNVPRAIERREDIVARHTTRTATRAGGATFEGASRASAARRESAEDVLAEFKPLFVAAGGPAGDESALPAGERVADPPQGDTARHLEQAQILMRTIRNARPGDRPGTIADERLRSQKLLYRNIVLRREAARTGNAPVEHALDSLEPLLIDIANLPERASREDVSVIQERVRRKNIVAVLQANIAAVPRAYQ